MKLTRLLLYFILSALLLACQGEEGEPGPQGEQGEQGIKGEDGENGKDGKDGEDGVGFTKKGFFEGTVSGHRQNGIAFSEPFKYEYANIGIEAFIVEYEFENPSLDLYRGFSPDERSTYLNLTLELRNQGEPNESLVAYPGDSKDESFFSFYKEITATNLFVIEASAKMQPMEFVHPIKPALNTTYKFLLSEYGFAYDYDYVNDEVVFRTSENKKVYYDDNGDLVKVLNANGTSAANSPYDQIRWSGGIFFDLGGNDLSSTEHVPADVLSITNVTFR